MSISAASSNLGSSEASDEVKLSGLAEPPENSEAVKLSQGRDNTHWANVYYLQNKYSFPLAAWASWTWRPPIWLDWLASEFRVPGLQLFVSPSPLHASPHPECGTRSDLTQGWGANSSLHAFRTSNWLTIASATPTTHYILQRLFLFLHLLIFFLNFPNYPLRDDWCSISTCCSEKHLLLYSIQHKFFTNNLIKHFQAELVSTQGLHPYCLAFLVLEGTTHTTRRQR